MTKEPLYVKFERLWKRGYQDRELPLSELDDVHVKNYQHLDYEWQVWRSMRLQEMTKNKNDNRRK